MLNNFALSKIPSEQEDTSDEAHEKVLIHSDPSCPTEQWRVRRRSSINAEDICNR